MKKLFFSLAFTFLLFNANAQRADTANKLILTLDWLTGNITNKLQSGNTSKKIRPKVGSYITIKVINLPENYSATGEVEFENGNIEGGGIFNGFFKPETTPSLSTPSNPTKTTADADSIKKEATKIIETASKAIDNKSQEKIKAVLNESNKSKKIEISNLIESLEIGNVSNFLWDKNIISDTLFSKPENKLKLKKAKEDYASQQRLIQIAYDNISEKIKLKDSVIALLSKTADSLNVKKDTAKKLNFIKNQIFDIQVPNSDISNIKIAIKNDKEKTVNEIPLSYYNKWGYKIDFSTGFFHTNLQDQEYEKVNKIIPNANNVNVSVDSIYQIKQKDKGKGKIAIGILAHYYPRLFSYFNIGISGGFSYQTETKVLSYLLGSSLLFGNQQRFILSFGAAFGRVKELDKNFFQLNTDYHKSVLNEKIEIPMADKLKSSFFFGVSYNLGTINSTKSVKRNF